MGELGEDPGAQTLRSEALPVLLECPTDELKDSLRQLAPVDEFAEGENKLLRAN